MQKTSPVVIVGGLLVIVAFALAAILLVAPGPEATQRLGLFFAIVGTTVASLVAALKSSQAASNTNGSLDNRIEAAVFRAQNVRRREVRGEQAQAAPTPTSADPLQLE